MIFSCYKHIYHYSAFNLFCRSWEQPLMSMPINIRNVPIASLTCWLAVTGGILHLSRYLTETSENRSEVMGKYAIFINLLIHACGYYHIRSKRLCISSVKASYINKTMLECSILFLKWLLCWMSLMLGLYLIFSPNIWFLHKYSCETVLLLLILLNVQSYLFLCCFIW